MKLVKETNKTLKDSEKISEKEAEEAFVKIINDKEIQVNFVDTKKVFDPKKIYKDEPNPTKL